MLGQAIIGPLACGVADHAHRDEVRERVRFLVPGQPERREADDVVHVEGPPVRLRSLTAVDTDLVALAHGTPSGHPGRTVVRLVAGAFGSVGSVAPVVAVLRAADAVRGCRGLHRERCAADGALLDRRSRPVLRTWKCPTCPVVSVAPHILGQPSAVAGLRAETATGDARRRFEESTARLARRRVARWLDESSSAASDGGAAARVRAVGTRPALQEPDDLAALRAWRLRPGLRTGSVLARLGTVASGLCLPTQEARTAPRANSGTLFIGVGLASGQDASTNCHLSKYTRIWPT
jgi:hypothetical protein